MDDGHEGWEVELTPARHGRRQLEPTPKEAAADGEGLSIADLVEAVDEAAVLLAEVGAKLDALRSQIFDVAYPAGARLEIAKIRRRIRESATRIAPPDPRSPGSDSASQSDPAP